MTDNLVPNAFVSLLLLRSVVCLCAVWGDRVLRKVKSIDKIIHPVALFGSLAAFGERLLNKKPRRCARLDDSNLSSANLYAPSLYTPGNLWRGLLWSLSLLLLSMLFGVVLERLVSSLASSFAQAGEEAVGSDLGFALGFALGFGFLLLTHSFLCAWLIAQAQLDEYVAKVERELTAGNLLAARRALSHIVGRKTSSLSSQAVSRAAMESLAENFSDGTIAPLIYYMLFGLPGLLLYKAANTLDSQFGYRGARYGEFGRASARIDDLANLLPARITAYGICLVALFMRGLSGLAAFRVMWHFAPSLIAWAYGGFRSSPNAPHPEAALAGALGVRLAGKRVYKMHGETWRVGEWIGYGTKNCNSNQIGCARLLINCTMLFFIVILIFTIVTIIWRYGLWSYPLSI